jgi:hypothetical protein
VSNPPGTILPLSLDRGQPNAICLELKSPSRMKGGVTLIKDGSVEFGPFILLMGDRYYRM